jgi:hypothetical protein
VAGKNFVNPRINFIWNLNTESEKGMYVAEKNA